MNTQVDHVITVGQGSSAYDVYIGSALLPRAAELIQSAGLKGTARIVADRNVWTLHGARLFDGFKQLGISPPVLEIEAGEDKKKTSSPWRQSMTGSWSSAPSDVIPSSLLAVALLATWWGLLPRHI